MSWLFSQALVAEYSADTCSAGAPSAQSNGNPTPQAYCAPDKMTAFSRLSRFGMTFAPLTEDRGAELLTLFQAASRARTSAPRGGAQESTEHAADSGAKWHESSVKYDPALCSWKTYRSLWEEALPWSSVTLPRWGMTRNGLVLQHPISERPISATGSGLLAPTHSGNWPTPTCADTRTDKLKSTQQKEGSMHSVSLAQVAQMWPARWATPSATDGTRGGTVAENMTGQSLTQQVNTLKFATPQARDFRSGQQSRWDDPRRTRNLNDRIAKFPTPTCMDHIERKGMRPSREETGRTTGYLSEAVPGQLNPTWVEWLMGWPLGWTDLKPLETDKFREWQQQHSNCCAE